MDEIFRAKQIMEEERAGPLTAGLPAGSPQLGCMVEVPSAVLIASEIAETVDFLCLGTNDLVQYLLAVDRDNAAAAESYELLHPGVLRAIRHVVEAANAVGRATIVCGEMAGSPFYVPLLIGLGVRTFRLNV